VSRALGVAFCLLLAGCADPRPADDPSGRGATAVAANATEHIHRPSAVGGPPSVGLVPWRDPRGDMARFFAGATGHESETRILSHRSLELAERLGRPPVGDDLLLRLYRVYREKPGASAKQRVSGAILVQRVRGEHGAIEVVLAVSPEGKVRGARLQRAREPGEVMDALTGGWLRAFTGKSARDSWRVGTDLPAVPLPARASADAVAVGARTALILFEVASREPKG
jgi:hypothetical protein